MTPRPLTPTARRLLTLPRGRWHSLAELLALAPEHPDRLHYALLQLQRRGLIRRQTLAGRPLWQRPEKERVRL